MILKLLEATRKVEHEPLQEGADLEAVIKNEIDFLERCITAHSDVMVHYQMMVNAYKDKLRAAGIAVKANP